MTENTSWLSNLNEAIPVEAYGTNVCTYTVALEGWRRGLTLKFFTKFIGEKWNLRFSLSNSSGREREFAVSRGDLVTQGAIKICSDNNLTREFLSDANISMLDENEHFIGEDYRIYVIEDKIIGAVKKLPANVTGNGSKTIKQLINEKNIEREENPYLKGRPIKIDKELKNYLQSLNLSLESVPEKGQRVFLSKDSNITAGGESIDVTDELTPEIKSMAIQALNAIPGLVQGAVEMKVNQENNSAVVLNISSKADISLHLFPVEGEARDIPAAIIDYYFPETKDANKKTNLFFDFKSISKPLEAGLLQEVMVPSVPEFRHQAKSFTVSGEVQSASYREWVQGKAISLKLNGFTKELLSGKVQVVISGPKAKMEKFEVIINTKSPKAANVTQVTEKLYKKPIKIGFEIKSKANKKISRK